MKPTRPAAVVIAASASLVLSGCGSFHHGGTAATFEDTTVSVDRVQESLKDLKAIAPQANVSPADAATYLALRPALMRIGSQYGVGVSRDGVRQQVRQEKPGVDVSDAGIDLLQSNSLLQALGDNPKASAAADRLVKNGKLELNPRYGAFDQGRIVEAPRNWLQKTDQAQAR